MTDFSAWLLKKGLVSKKEHWLKSAVELYTNKECDDLKFNIYFAELIEDYFGEVRTVRIPIKLNQQD